MQKVNCSVLIDWDSRWRVFVVVVVVVVEFVHLEKELPNEFLRHRLEKKLLSPLLVSPRKCRHFSFCSECRAEVSLESKQKKKMYFYLMKRSHLECQLK